MVDEWNGFSNQILSAELLESIKRTSDKFEGEINRRKLVFHTGTATWTPGGLLYLSL